VCLLLSSSPELWVASLLTLDQIVGGSDHVLTAKLTLSQEKNGMLIISSKREVCWVALCILIRSKTILLIIYLLRYPKVLLYFGEILCWNLIAVNIKKEAGPISMTFTIPMFNASKLQVNESHNPFSWVRCSCYGGNHFWLLQQMISRCLILLEVCE